MDVFLKGGMAFVETKRGMLCIGREEEIRKATEDELLVMIHEASVLAQWFAVESSHKQTIH